MIFDQATVSAWVRAENQSCMSLTWISADRPFAFAAASTAAQLFFPAQQAGLADDFPAHRATVLAWNNSALFLGISLGSLIGGQAISHVGFTANLRISAAIAIVGWTINQAVMPNTARPQGAAIDLR